MRESPVRAAVRSTPGFLPEWLLHNVVPTADVWLLITEGAYVDAMQRLFEGHKPPVRVVDKSKIKRYE